MGKPGGFFKKLKAKQKREAAHRRRGTKGASKEERRHKHNERVEYYAAKREAEDLAAVSSSSDSEPSTDSEQEMAQCDRKLRKLRSLLGIQDTAAASKSRKQRAKRARRPSPGSSGSELDGEGATDSDSGEGHEAASEDSIVDSEKDDSEGDGEVAKETTSARRRKRAKTAADDVNGETGKDDDDEGEADDWETFLGASADGEETATDSGGEGDDASDRLNEDDLLIDNISDDDEPDGSDDEGGEANPFFDLLEEGEEGEGGDGDEEDLMDPEEFEEEETEEDESDAEDEFVDDDNEDNTDSGEAREKDRAPESRALLPQFKLGSTSLATLQSSGVVTSADDPWYLKYHVDAAKEIDRSPLGHVPVHPQALEALRDANEGRRQRAKRREAEEGIAVTRKDVMFVTAEDYDTVHPENVSVAATSAARNYFERCPPFAAAATAAAGKPPPYMHETLWRKWVQYRAGSATDTPYFSNTAGIVLTPEERGFFDILQGYADVMDCTRCWQNAESRREMFVLHLLNHWFKARAVVVAHDKMLAAHKERRRRRRQKQQEEQRKKKKQVEGNGQKDSGKKRGRKITFADEQPGHSIDGDSAAEADDDDDDDDDLELRDRGFGKTRLFVMLPMRNQAYEYVNTIVRLLGADPADCPKLAMFEQDFTEVAEAMDPTFKRRPKEYRRQFAGNIDDSFCVGLRLEPNRVHVYAHPLNSDIILCSPLGLRRRLEKNGDILVSLSSIEVCVVDEAHVLLEQNWQQVTAVMELLNKRPTETTHGLSDLRRVYAWSLEGKSGRHRQTIISSDLSNATILSTFRSAVNSFGKVVLQHCTEEGVLGKVQVPVRQHFIRFGSHGLDSLDDDRFHFFTTNVYPTKVHPLVERDVRTIIVVPSYFDFVRLRNHMYREYRESFTAISEYTSIKQQRRSLGQFSDLERPVLLVTERFYFFKRYFVKFAEVLIFYSPPLFPSFYTSLVNRLVATSPNAFVMTVFSQYDTHELNRLVGTSRMRHMLERESGIFSFVTS